jgi:hypothetical protein
MTTIEIVEIVDRSTMIGRPSFEHLVGAGVRPPSAIQKTEEICW